MVGWQFSTVTYRPRSPNRQNKQRNREYWRSWRDRRRCETLVSLGLEAVVPGLVTDAAANAAQTATSVIDTIAEVPERLDEALQYAIARIEKDPRNVEAIIRHLGWDGRFAGAEDRVGQPIDSASERAKQLAGRAIERLREDRLVPNAVERSISLIEQSLPILEMELWEALLNARLCFAKLSCDALVAAAQAFREKPTFEIVRLGGSVGLAKAGTAAGINQLASRAQGLMESHGCANIIDLTEDARAMFGPNASRRFTEAVVRTVGRFEWLDQAKGWFWYIPDRGDSGNRLVNQIRQILAATPQVQLAQLRSAIRHQNGLRYFAPPLNVLASICRRLLFLQIKGDAVVRAFGLMPWDAVLAQNEAIFVEVLRSCGPVLGRQEFLDHCRQRGMSEDTFNQFTSHSAIVQTPQPGVYTLVGATRPAATIGDIGVASIGDPSASTEHGFLSEGQVFVAWKLQLSTLQSGVLRVPEPVNTFVEGDYKLKTIGNRELGHLHFRQRACWDVRRLLHYTGGEPEDTMVIVLSLRDQRAIGILGGDDVVARVTSGGVELPVAVPDEDRRPDEHGEFGAA
jgi:hypothetical protein